MQITASTIEQLLRALPADRRRTVEAIRNVILENIDAPFVEQVENGAIGYVVPHSVFPAGYHCNPAQPLPFAAIAAQKHHIGLYLFCVYSDPKLEKWFRATWLEAGKKLDMGKSCVRVKTLDDVPLDVVGTLFKRVKARTFIKRYEAAVPPSARRASTKTTPAKPRPRKRTAATSPPARKSAATKRVGTKRVARRP